MGAGFALRKFPLAGDRDSPAGVTGERGRRKRVFLSGVTGSESSLAVQRSCGSLGPFTEKDDEARGAGFLRQGHQRAGFRSCGSLGPFTETRQVPPPGSPESSGFQYWGAGFPLRKFPLVGDRGFPIAFQRSCGSLGERDSLARVTRERDFRKRVSVSPSPEGGFSAEITAKRDFLAGSLKNGIFPIRSSRVPLGGGAGFPRQGHRGAGFSIGSLAEFSPAWGRGKPVAGFQSLP